MCVCAHVSVCVTCLCTTGKLIQQFDYSKEDGEKEFMCAVASPSGQSVVIGSFDRYINVHSQCTCMHICMYTRLY